MGLPRSTFYDAPSVAVEDAEIVGRMRAICGEFRDVRVPPRRGCPPTARSRRQQQKVRRPHA